MQDWDRPSAWNLRPNPATSGSPAPTAASMSPTPTSLAGRSGAPVNARSPAPVCHLGGVDGYCTDAAMTTRSCSAQRTSG